VCRFYLVVYIVCLSQALLFSFVSSVFIFILLFLLLLLLLLLVCDFTSMTSYASATWQWVSSLWWGEPTVEFDPRLCSSLISAALIRIRLRFQKTQNTIVQQRKELLRLIDAPSATEKDMHEHYIHLRVSELISNYRLETALQGVTESLETINAYFPIISVPGEITAQPCLQALSSVIYAAARIDIDELNRMMPQLRAKLGKVFMEHALSNHEQMVMDKVADNLSAQQPDDATIHAYLMQIAPHKYKPHAMPAPSYDSQPSSEHTSLVTYPSLPPHAGTGDVPVPIAFGVPLPIHEGAILPSAPPPE